MSKLFDDYHFVYAGGSCGSFLKLVWSHYACLSSQIATVPELRFNKLTGDARNHFYLSGQLGHFPSITLKEIKEINPDKKIVLIVFDLDDIELIIRLHYVKFTKDWLENNLETAKSLYPRLAEKLSDPSKWQQTWLEFQKENYAEWLRLIDSENADFLIDFKTIYGKSDKDLNQLIAAYFKTSISPKAAKFISEYQALNHTLYGK